MHSRNGRPISHVPHINIKTIIENYNENLEKNKLPIMKGSFYEVPEDSSVTWKCLIIVFSFNSVSFIGGVKN